jgi:hypothetical protein
VAGENVDKILVGKLISVATILCSLLDLVGVPSLATLGAGLGGAATSQIAGMIISRRAQP